MSETKAFQERREAMFKLLEQVEGHLSQRGQSQYARRARLLNDYLKGQGKSARAQLEAGYEACLLIASAEKNPAHGSRPRKIDVKAGEDHSRLSQRWGRTLSALLTHPGPWIDDPEDLGSLVKNPSMLNIVAETMGELSAPLPELDLSLEPPSQAYATNKLGSCMYSGPEEDDDEDSGRYNGSYGINNYDHSGVQALVAREGDEVTQRALLWRAWLPERHDRSNNPLDGPGREALLLDRIYPVSPSSPGTRAIQKHAREQGWMIRSQWGGDVDTRDHTNLSSPPVGALALMRIRSHNRVVVPYIDSFAKILGKSEMHDPSGRKWTVLLLTTSDSYPLHEDPSDLRDPDGNEWISDYDPYREDLVMKAMLTFGGEAFADLMGAAPEATEAVAKTVTEASAASGAG